MTNNNYTTTKDTFKHLTDVRRDRFEEMKKSGNHTQVQMASNRTVYNCYLADAGAQAYQKMDDFVGRKTSESTLRIF